MNVIGVLSCTPALRHTYLSHIVVLLGLGMLIGLSPKPVRDFFGKHFIGVTKCTPIDFE